MGHSDSESSRSTSQSSNSGSDEPAADSYSDLANAIENGSVDDVAGHLRSDDGAANTRFTYHFRERRLPSNGVTPLLAAAALGKKAIAQLLLDHGASVHGMDRDFGSTPIIAAAEHGQSEMVDLLLRNGASVNDVTDYDRTPLMYAAYSGCPEMAHRLIAEGADVGHLDSDGWNALVWASRHGHVEIIRHLLDIAAAADNINRKDFINVQDDDGWTSINRAICNDHFECVQELLSDPDIDLTLRDNEGDTALSIAARSDFVFIMVQILGTEAYFPDDPVGCETCIATPFEFSYIEKAFLNGIEQALRSPHDQDRTMYWAVANGSQQVVQKCLDRQPNLVRWSRAGATWVHVAAKHGRHELIKMFISRGLDICAAANKSTAALHLAAAGGHRITVRYILESLQGSIRSPAYRSNVLAAGKSPRPGLELIRFIVEENDDGESPITLSGKARNRGASDILWGEIEKFALTTANFVESLPMEPEHLMELAAQFERPGDERILKLLLRQINKNDSTGKSQNWTALHWAVDSSRAVVVWWLLSNGSHLRSEEIQTALQIVNGKANSGSGVSRVDLLIKDLLQNPPMISAHAVNEDDYHLPELPALPDNHQKHLEQEGIIVDFYWSDQGVDFQFKRRILREMIYERGPNAIMESVGRHTHDDLGELKKQLGETKQAPQLDANGVKGVTGGVISDTATFTLEPEPQNDASSVKTTERNEPSGDIKSAERPNGFRWMHIPAHNMKTVEDLITRIVIDSGKTKRQHGPLVDLLKQGLVEIAAGGGKRYMKPQFIKRAMEDTAPTDGMEQPDKDSSSNGGSDDGSEDESSESSSDGFTNDSVALYMPFLTVSEIPAQTDIRHEEPAQGPTVVSRTKQPQGAGEEDPLESLHERMTLDQYYYTTLPDSTNRDHDQVLSRYLGWQEFEHFHDSQTLSSEELEHRGVPVKVFSVDQLWLWVIDDATIVTASTSDFESLVDNAFDALVFGETKGGFPRPNSVRSMMEFMLGIVTAPQMQSVPVLGKKKTKQPLEVFREYIRHVADIETKMSRNFIDSVVGGYCAVLPKRDVGKEYRLLYEIKDIRDELAILKALAESQEAVWRQAFRVGQSGDDSEQEDHPQRPGRSILEIQEMAREAESVQDAINTLLDLRQKHAGNQDAEFGRQQANTTMVFTIVTIIFLPLSFLASLFALNVSEFPHEANDVKFKSSWIFPIIFGCSAAVSIPSIIIAFNVNELITMIYYRLRLPPFGRPRHQRPVPSSVRRLTETTSSSTDLDSAAPFSKLQTRLTSGGFSRELTGTTVTSLYERLLGKAPSGYRQPDDCESGKGQI
ncbi:CorA-like Mg2+ transporter protein [Aspergillus sp. HF37]|nr:CorA-like Mg2+ transporter protein [Aspergillus sp. HF37]